VKQKEGNKQERVNETNNGLERQQRCPEICPYKCCRKTRGFSSDRAILPTISLVIEKKPKLLIINTGSSLSILQPGVSRSNIGVTVIKLYCVTGENRDIQGQQRVTFILPEERLDTFWYALFRPKQTGYLVPIF
jgi:hypothetical protein